jgi:N-acetylmuramoyl-L-alanine amidase
MRLLPLLVFTFFSPYVFALNVMIDPGHGGTDQGAVASENRESEITLKVSHYLQDLLKSDSRFNAGLTRDTDKFLTLEQRAEIANNAKVDLFLSIHVNSSKEEGARGKEIYFQNQLPPDEEALFLASRENQGAKIRTDISKGDVAAIVEDLERNHRLRLSGKLSEELYRHWNGDRYRRRTTIRQAPFYVISNVNMPSALVEIGYLTNPQEAKKLSDDSYLRKIAQGLHQALISYKEFIDKSARQRLD